MSTQAPIEPTEAQNRVISHAAGPLLVGGVAGSGRTEALARRLARLEEHREHALVLTRSPSAADRIRARAEEVIQGPFEELTAHTHRETAIRLLGEFAEVAGTDPFCEPLTVAERLALLLEHLEELPLRRHQIRGNPTGLLARLIARIDALKAAAVSSAAFAAWAEGSQRDARGDAELDAAARDVEFGRLYEIHDGLLREAGAIDGGQAVMDLAAVISERPAAAQAIADRYPHLLVDELEDACPADLELIGRLAENAASVTFAWDPEQRRHSTDANPGWVRERFPGIEEVRLEPNWRFDGTLMEAAGAVLAPARAADAPDMRALGPSTEVRYWRCENERAEAQAVAREVGALLASGVVEPSGVCVAVPGRGGSARTIAAALEERSIPYRIDGPGEFFARPEIRDVIAWLRLLADPADAAAAVRVLSRAPVDLRSVDLARCTTIARRRKLDMVSALEAGLESPQISPEARERIRAFLSLYDAASRAMGQMRADVFVRRLIERVGFRQQRLFAAHPEAAERLRNLSRLGELAESWARREPHGSNPDFVRYLIAVSEAGMPPDERTGAPHGDSVRVIGLDRMKGLEFDHVFLTGLHAGNVPAREPAGGGPVPAELTQAEADDHMAAERRLLYTAMTRARRTLVMSRPQATDDGAARPSPFFEEARAVLDEGEETYAEELFGPAEGLHATFRMMRDEVLEAAWRAGGRLSEPRLDTYLDVNRAVARFLEMVKIAALLQRPGAEASAEAVDAVNELLEHAISPEQRAAMAESGLDSYLLDEERESRRRQELIAAQDEPSLEAFLPKRGAGLALSATDIELYRTCPLKYKFGRVFGIPQEQTINMRFGIAMHKVLERFHGEEAAGRSDEAGSIERLIGLFDQSWRRGGFGRSDDELQFRERALDALRRYHQRQSSSQATPRWLERKFDFQVGPHHIRGRVDRVDELPGGRFELIDYKTGDPKPQRDLEDDIQLAIYRIAAREAWQLESSAGSYWYVLADEKVDVGGSSDDRERIERVVMEVGEGIQSQDFEPRPSPVICSWCDFKLICPASEA